MGEEYAKIGEALGRLGKGLQTANKDWKEVYDGLYHLREIDLLEASSYLRAMFGMVQDAIMPQPGEDPAEIDPHAMLERLQGLANALGMVGLGTEQRTRLKEKWAGRESIPTKAREKLIRQKKAYFLSGERRLDELLQLRSPVEVQRYLKEAQSHIEMNDVKGALGFLGEAHKLAEEHGPGTLHMHIRDVIEDFGHAQSIAARKSEELELAGKETGLEIREATIEEIEELMSAIWKKEQFGRLVEKGIMDIDTAHERADELAHEAWEAGQKRRKKFLAKRGMETTQEVITGQVTVPYKVAVHMLTHGKGEVIRVDGSNVVMRKKKTEGLSLSEAEDILEEAPGGFHVGGLGLGAPRLPPFVTRAKKAVRCHECGTTRLPKEDGTCPQCGKRR